MILDSESRLLKLAFSAIAVAIAFLVAHDAVGLGGAGLDAFSEDGLYTAIEFAAAAVCLARVVRRREDRTAWALIALGVLSWAGGDLIWTVWLNGVANPPSPSVADALYIAMYPSIYAALALLMRAHFRHAGPAMWLDGIVVGLAIAAVGAALVLPSVLATGAENAATAAVNLAYPLGDFSLLVFIALGFALCRWRPGRQWLTLGAGLAISAGADMVFLYQEAHGAYVAGSVLDAMWPLSMAVLALSAWLPAGSARRVSSPARHTILLPTAFAAVALGLLVSATFQRLTPVAVALAAATMLAAGARAALTYVENDRMLRRERRNAVTDLLTGLGNRRRLIAELEATFAEEVGGTHTLAFFDLNGFKRYNDSFGHGAGDALLGRLGNALAAAVDGLGRAYRLGGDEFCVLLRGAFPREHDAIERALGALCEHGSGFSVSASFGSVVLPLEAGTVSEALNLADERMYAHKSAGQGASRVRAQSALMQQSVLMQLLSEREPTLREHVCDVGRLAMEVGREFELNSEQLDELRRAGELHDLGKLAIPDQILSKPGPLDESEWQLMRQHTLIGERILNASAALRPVAALVRSSHERWDGGGYPDGLAGEEIALGARIIAVCDAYDAMVSARPYDGARSPADALAELRRSGGTQFDPRVVSVVCEQILRGQQRDQRPPRVPAAGRSARPLGADQAPSANNGQRPGTPLRS